MIVPIGRNEDGTINMNGYLELTDAAPANAGARMTGTASKVIIPSGTAGSNENATQDATKLPSNDSSSTGSTAAGAVVPTPAPVTTTTPGQSTSPKTYDDSQWFEEELMPEKLPVAQPADDAEAPVASGAADAVDVPVVVGVDAVNSAVNGEGFAWLLIIAIMGVFGAGLAITARRYLKEEE